MVNKKELNDLKKTRELMIHRLTKFEEYMNNLDSTNIPLGEFKTRYNIIQKSWDAFERVQTQLEEFEPDTNPLIIRDKFESEYYRIVGKAEDILSMQNKIDTKESNLRLPSVEQDIRLPTLQLPTFSGKFDEWISFFNIFKDLVHDNKYYRPSVKLKYLKNSLRGEAYSIIESLDLTSENYEVALQLLQDRYDNPTRAILKHVAGLFDLPKVEKISTSSLHLLLETSQKHIRSLKALGQPTDSWDVILIHLISSKFDSLTFKEWKNVSPTKELPSMKLFVEFLENYCQKLDEITTHNTATSSKTKPVKAIELKNSSRCLLVENKGKSCTLCKDSHMLYSCKQFIAMSTDNRFSFVKNNHLCINCLRNNHKVSECKSSLCRICGKNHHTLLHRQSSATEANKPLEGRNPSLGASPQIDSQNTSSNSLPNRTNGDSLTLISSAHQPSSVLLSTANILVFGPNGKRISCKALLDSGSQSSYITSSLSDRLQLKRNNLSMTVCGFSNSAMPVYHHAKAKIASNVTNFCRMLDFLIVPKITDYAPQVDFDLKSLQLPPHIVLADPNFHQKGEIEMLLGANIFWDLIGLGMFEIPNISLKLRETKLGWIIAGKTTVSLISYCHLTSQGTLESIDKNLCKFWELETIYTSTYTSEQLVCEQLYETTTSRSESGRYIVQMPLRNELTMLGDSKEIALRRFNTLEARFERNPDLKLRYQEFIEEYLKLGHMIEVDPKEFDSSQTLYFVPHHPVFKEVSSSTKIRVVFDFSSKTSSGYSLNDVLAVGPTIQPSLFNHLVRARTYPILICGDLEKMFRQILIDPKQTSLQLILWRNSPEEHLKIYKLLTVSYGSSCASWLATRTLKQLALDHPHSLTSTIIENEFYMDDLASGCESAEEAIQIKEHLTSHLMLGGFRIRKWSSNSMSFMESIPEPDRELKSPISFDKEPNVRTLGLLWYPLEDSFAFAVDLEEFSIESQKSFTKRSVLSCISKLFDPLGLLGPVTTKARILMQELWRLKYDWDEALPKHFVRKWKIYCQAMLRVKDIKIPRRIIADDCLRVEIHGFSDASVEAYGACLYLRSIDSQGNIFVRLITSKARIAPLKVQSIPRLELCAALLLAELVHQTLPSFNNVSISNITYWSDSSVVLSWIKQLPVRWNTFVANRVSKIQELTNPTQWKHVRSQHNPADLISRGLYADQLLDNKLWWSGTSWLIESFDNQPCEEFECLTEEDLPEVRKQTTNTLIGTLDKNHITSCLTRVASFNKVVRIIAFCYRFLRCRRYCKGKRPIGPITAIEFTEAKLSVLRIAQQAMFPQEYHDLIRGKSIKTSSCIANLCPVLDSDQLIRVGGRLESSHLTSDKKHPIILSHGGPKEINKLTFNLAREIHVNNCHIGPQALLTVLREQYWPLSGRNLCRKVYRTCVKCFRADPKPQSQQMGNLPELRVKPSQAFYYCGVDYAGPLYVRNSLRRNSSTSKAYICLFVCLSTKAIHIELVEDLTSNSFLAALKRFISRRGKPLFIYSDNATTFVGARNELLELRELWKCENHRNAVINFLSKDNIEWRFIPPKSPNFGGLWESNIKSIKTLLKRAIGSRSLTLNEFYTVLTQIEACINSRPLFPLPSEPNDLSVLTPAHFLIGSNLLAPPEPDLRQQPSNRLTRWQLVQQSVQHFWRRWSSEYLQELQRRTKWRAAVNNLTKGTLVLIKNEQVPPLSWPLGRVEDVHPGPDGKVRVATIKTISGVVKRNVRCLCPLPLEEGTVGDSIIEDVASRRGDYGEAACPQKAA